MRTLLWIAVVAGCGGDDGAVVPDAAIVATDAASDAAVDQTTALTATMLATRVLDRAYYGVNANGSLHVEVYRGGGTGCPEMNSPTPEYTLILGGVMPAGGASPGNFLDYEGDMLPNMMLGQAASSVMLTSVVYQAGMSVALDAMLTFPAGTITGHLYATHCTSLDG